MWGATEKVHHSGKRNRISTHAPRVGCDEGLAAQFGGYVDFNSRTPCGVRRMTAPLSVKAAAFQLTHPVWGATCGRQSSRRPSKISTHAPRVGCDRSFAAFIITFFYFNSRTPCGVRHAAGDTFMLTLKFQLTHPVWGATNVQTTEQGHVTNFNSRTPCGVRLKDKRDSQTATPISTHAPRVGCDAVQLFTVTDSLDFNSRTPCGVRLDLAEADVTANQFQLTHPVWGATRWNALRARNLRFQLTHPVWGATCAVDRAVGLQVISTHAPRVGCDFKLRVDIIRGSNFNSRTPCGVRLDIDWNRKVVCYFNSRTPCGVRP